MSTFSLRRWWEHWGDRFWYKFDRKDLSFRGSLRTPELRRFGISEFNIEFYAKSKSFHFDLKVGEDWEDGILLSMAVPPLSLYLGVEGSIGEKVLNALGGLPKEGHKDWYPGDDREIGFRIHHWALWWSVWHSTHWGSSDTPWYRQGSFHFRDWFLDLVFGKEVYTREKGERFDIVVPLPEGHYLVRLTPETATWKRPRAKAKVWQGVYCEPYVGLPYPDKGTTEYNCGEDGLFGMNVESANPDVVCAALIAHVMETRAHRYGGDGTAYRPEQNPPLRLVEQRAVGLQRWGEVSR